MTRIVVVVWRGGMVLGDTGVVVLQSGGMVLGDTGVVVVQSGGMVLGDTGRCGGGTERWDGTEAG